MESKTLKLTQVQADVLRECLSMCKQDSLKALGTPALTAIERLQISAVVKAIGEIEDLLDGNGGCV